MAVLFGGSIFACRHCQKLTYECQRETDDDRAARRADTIRRRLGWKVGIANPVGDKPKGMHWRTFVRLKAEYAAFANTAWAGMAVRLGLMNRRLDSVGLILMTWRGRLNLFRKMAKVGSARQAALDWEETFRLSSLPKIFRPTLIDQSST